MLRIPVLLLVLTAPAMATPIADIVCAPRDEMSQKLTRQFGETRIATGIRDMERILEVWTSERTGDWTLVMTYANGQSCIVAMGEDWSPAIPVSKDDPA